MGLDMYLRAKTDTKKYEGATGACGGLFGMAPNDAGMVEIGYWRKAYDQQDLICSVIASYDAENDNCENFKITAAEVDKILKEARSILKTHTFDKEGFDLASDYENTWDSKRKWKDTIKFFKTAKDILKKDKTAEIYYCQWY